jgi:hypothetical protein
VFEALVDSTHSNRNTFTDLNHHRSKMQLQVSLAGPHFSIPISRAHLTQSLIIAIAMAAAPISAQDDRPVTVNCAPPGNGVFTAPRDGFSSFIDRIPQQLYNLDEGPIGFASSDGGSSLCAEVRTKCEGCGYQGGGDEIQRMLRQGFNECVADGPDRFPQYFVENPYYTTKAGGGTCAGMFGIPGKSVQI